MKTSKKTPYDFIQRNYRDPGGEDPIKRWLPHPENARAVCAALLDNGMPEQDIEDGMQDVFVRALKAFGKGARVPADLREMKAFCAAVAKKHAMATLRKAARRERLGNAGPCDADEHTPLEYGAPPHRDPIDAGRQLDVLEELFREGRMPEHGVRILEAVGEGCSHEEIAQELGITVELSKWRLRTMRELYRRQLVKLGLSSGTERMLAIAGESAAVEPLRKAA